MTVIVIVAMLRLIHTNAKANVTNDNAPVKTTNNDNNFPPQFLSFPCAGTRIGGCFRGGGFKLTDVA